MRTTPVVRRRIPSGVRPSRSPAVASARPAAWEPDTIRRLPKAGGSTTRATGQPLAIAPRATVPLPLQDPRQHGQPPVGARPRDWAASMTAGLPPLRWTPSRPLRACESGLIIDTERLDQ